MRAQNTKVVGQNPTRAGRPRPKQKTRVVGKQILGEKPEPLGSPSGGSVLNAGSRNVRGGQVQSRTGSPPSGGRVASQGPVGRTGGTVQSAGNVARSGAPASPARSPLYFPPEEPPAAAEETREGADETAPEMVLEKVEAETEGSMPSMGLDLGPEEDAPADPSHLEAAADKIRTVAARILVAAGLPDCSDHAVGLAASVLSGAIDAAAGVTDVGFADDVPEDARAVYLAAREGLREMLEFSP